MIALPAPNSARHSTTSAATAYLGESGRLMGNPQSRGWVHSTIRQWLRVARKPDEISRVMRVWREIHYLAKPAKGKHHDPIGRESIRIHYYLDMPALRVPPSSWYPAAAITIRYCLPGGVPKELGLESPMQALEIARSFVADDIRTIRDFSPEVLREVVRRIRTGADWQSVVKGRVLWKPQWLLTFSDPAVGHDGGLYRGAGAQYLGARPGGKEVWGWPLTSSKQGEIPSC